MSKAAGAVVTGVAAVEGIRKVAANGSAHRSAAVIALGLRATCAAEAGAERIGFGPRAPRTGALVVIVIRSPPGGPT